MFIILEMENNINIDVYCKKIQIRDYTNSNDIRKNNKNFINIYLLDFYF